jgi:quercetin dioxygenase-like cupin family protein
MPFIDTRTIAARELRPGWLGRFVNSAHMTFGYWEVVKGASIHEHQHPEEEVWNIIEGEFEIAVAGESRQAGPGVVAVVPANAPHRVTALTAGRAIVVDHPVRREIGGVRTD